MSLVLSDIKKSYPDFKIDLSFDIETGKLITLLGPSGCGKTTAGLSILRLINPTSGQIRFEGTDIMELKGNQFREMRRQMQIIFQDPFSSLNPRMQIGESVAEGLRIHKLGNAQERRDQVIALLRRVGLEDYHYKRYPHEFSGGQRQRIAVARTVILEPDVILLDEPTSALDVSVQKQVLSLLSDLQVKHKLSYLFISHDLRVVRAMSHRIIVMRAGKIVETGTVRDVFEKPQQAYTRELARASIYHQPL